MLSNSHNRWLCVVPATRRNCRMTLIVHNLILVKFLDRRNHMCNYNMLLDHFHQNIFFVASKDRCHRCSPKIEENYLLLGYQWNYSIQHNLLLSTLLDLQRCTSCCCNHRIHLRPTTTSKSDCMRRRTSCLSSCSGCSASFHFHAPWRLLFEG